MGQNFVKTFDVLAIVKALRCKIIREIILSTMSSIFEEVVRSKQIMTLANIPWFDSRFMNLGSWSFSSQMQKSFVKPLKMKMWIVSIQIQNSTVEKLCMY